MRKDPRIQGAKSMGHKKKIEGPHMGENLVKTKMNFKGMKAQSFFFLL